MCLQSGVIGTYWCSRIFETNFLCIVYYHISLLRQSRRDGLFISRLSRNTRAIDVVKYIRNEANLNIRCDPIATRYDTYRSYYIHAAPQHHALILKPGMWPRDVLIKKYNPK